MDTTISAYEFFKTFPDEHSALEYIESIRWPNVVVCPFCDSGRTSRQKAYQYHQCKDCRKKFTVRTGTIYERSHIALDKWLYAMYLLQTARKGISSLQLSKELGIKQSSAWFLLHRLREACNVEAQRRFVGPVEVDETYIGCKEANKHERKKLHAGRGPVGKTAIVGARDRATGRVTAKPINGTDRHTLQRFVAEASEAGSVVYTDEAPGYQGMPVRYHWTVRHGVREFVNGMASTNGIESVWAVLKRGYNGVYHQWSAKHMARYIDEFTFRLNEGNVARPTMQRLESLVKGAVGKRLTYAALVGKPEAAE